MKLLSRLLSWLVTILLPLALTFLGLRLLLTHAFPEVVYRLPGFPADSYGFTLADRLHFSTLSIDYLLNNKDISFLGDLKMADGSPLFNERELSHMLDVKRAVQPTMWIGYASWFLVLGLGLWAWFGKWWREYLLGLQRGGWLTILLVVGIGFFATVDFWDFFTIFHGFFFTSGSWEFQFSDSLIRLFPLPFWESAFGFAGLLDIGIGLALALGLRKTNSH